MNSKASYTYIAIFFFTLIFSFFLKFDISNGGSSSDLSYHWKYILALKEDISILFEYNHTYKNGYPQHYPLHHLIISRFDFLLIKKEYYLNFYFILSLFLPILFYYCLENIFPEIDTIKKYLFHQLFICSQIFNLLPYGETLIYQLFFFY